MGENKMKAGALWIVLIGAVIHLILGLGQVALLAPVSQWLGIVQIVVGASGLYLIANKLGYVK